MSRQLKFHHRERIKKNRRFNWGRDLLNEPKYLGKAVNTPAPCSCWGCGNERRISGKPLHEIRSDIEFEEQTSVVMTQTRIKR